MQQKLFGTDGIRGVAGKFPMDGRTAYAIGRALVTYLQDKEFDVPKIIIGRDTRESGPMLEAALAGGIRSLGGEFLLAGVIPTAGIAFLTRNAHAQMGVMISASHNPYEDNGIKIFNEDGYKLMEDVQEDLEERILHEWKNGSDIKEFPINTTNIMEDALKQYGVFLLDCADPLTVKDMNIAVDCANGAAFEIAPRFFAKLGAHVDVIGNTPNGQNINAAYGSQHPEHLAKLVQEKKCDVGFALDGDADRLIAVDETGEILTGDQILCICATYLKSQGMLKNNMIVCTVMSNMGFYEAMQASGITVAVSDVGDQFVLQKMIETGTVLGGEDSGHLIYLDAHTTGDGLLASLLLLKAMTETKQSLSTLRRQMTVFPQVLVNVTIKEKKPLNELPNVMDEIRIVEQALGENGRVLVRYSGTQKICRIMVEGPNGKEISHMADRIAEKLQKL